MCLIHSIGGAFTKQPEELGSSLGSKRPISSNVLSTISILQRLVDHHVHIAGLGVGGTNAFVNPKDADVATPVSSFEVESLYELGGVADEEKADPQAVARLTRSSRGHINGPRQTPAACFRQTLPPRWIGQSRKDRVLCSERICLNWRNDIRRCLCRTFRSILTGRMRLRSSRNGRDAGRVS